MLKRMFSNSISAGVSRLGSLSALVAYQALISRGMTSAEFAYFGIFWLVGMIAIMVAGESVATIGMRQLRSFSTDQRASHVRDVTVPAIAVWFCLVAAACLLAIATFGLFVAGSTRPFDSPIALPLCLILWMSALSITCLMGELARAVDFYAVSSLFTGRQGSLILNALMLAAVLVLRSRDALSLPSVIVVSTAIAVVVAVASVLPILTIRSTKVAGDPSRRPMRFGEMLSQSSPIGLMAVASEATQQVDTVFLLAFLPPGDIATIYVVKRMLLCINAPLLLVNATIRPFVAEMWSMERKQNVQTLCQAGTLLGILAAAPILTAMLIFPDTCLGLFGDQYRQHAALLQILAVGSVAFVVTGPSALPLLMSGRQNILLLTTLATSAFHLLMSAVLVIRYGTTGAVIATAAGVSVANLVNWTLTRRLMQIDTSFLFRPSQVSRIAGVGKLIRERKRRGRSNQAVALD